MVTLFYVTLLILTTLFWGYIFYKKDYHPQPLKVVAQSFITGLFAMAPVFAYKYVYQTYLPMLSEHRIFRPLLDSALLSGIGVFIINLAILSLVLFILSGIMSVLLNFFNRSVLINVKNALKDEPLGFTFVSFMLGIAIYMQTLSQNILHIPIVGTVLGTILFLAIIEEYIKHLMVRIADDKKIKDIDDAITLSIVVGLAFAFLETIIYSFIAGDLKVIFYRALITIPVHLVASGIFGYYYGLSHFAKPIVELEGQGKTYRPNWLAKLLSLKRYTLYHEEKIIEGTFLATVFHALMNILFETGLGFLAVPLAVCGIALVFRMYKMSHIENILIVRIRRKA